MFDHTEAVVWRKVSRVQAQRQGDRRGACARSLIWAEDPEPRDPALKESQGWKEGSITNSSAFCMNLRKATKTSWLLLLFLLSPPK